MHIANNCFHFMTYNSPFVIDAFDEILINFEEILNLN